MEFLGLLLPFCFAWALVFAARRLRESGARRRETGVWAAILVVACAAAALNARWGAAGWWFLGVFSELSVAYALLLTVRARRG